MKGKELYKRKINIDLDENGDIKIGRVGVINQDQANSVQNYKGGNLEIELTVAPIKGTAQDNFGEADKVDWVPQWKDSEQREINKHINNKDEPIYKNQDDYGLASYGASHARTHSLDGGGGVKGRLPKNKPEGVNSVKFKINDEDNSISTDKKIKNYPTSNKSKKSGNVLNRK